MLSSFIVSHLCYGLAPLTVGERESLLRIGQIELDPDPRPVRDRHAPILVDGERLGKQLGEERARSLPELEHRNLAAIDDRANNEASKS